MKHLERTIRILLASVMLVLLFASATPPAAFAQEGGDDGLPPTSEEPPTPPLPKPPKPDFEEPPALPEGSLSEDLLLPQQADSVSIYDVIIDIQSYSDLATLQSMSLPCGVVGECQLEVTGDTLNAFKAADLSFFVVRKGIQAEVGAVPDGLAPAVTTSASVSRSDDVILKDYGDGAGSTVYGVEVSGAPDTAFIVDVDYDLRIAHTYVNDLLVNLRVHSAAMMFLWPRWGGVTDNGEDDDPEDDLDIELTRTITSAFDGLPVNGWYEVIAADNAPLDSGIFDYLTITVWYDDTAALSPPSNDDMAGAWGHNGNFVEAQYNNAATTEAGEPSYSCGSGVGATVWYRLTPSQTKTYMMETTVSNFDTVLHVFEDLGGGSLSLVACNDDYGNSVQSAVIFNAQAGKSYLISVGGYGATKGHIHFLATDIPPFAGCANQNSVPKAECKVLVDLYNSTNGPSWYENTGWLATKEVCLWQGVECYNGRVWGIELAGNNLDGSLPSSLGKLKAARYLNLPYNILTGSIPAALGDLSKLEYLGLAQNALTGSVPGTLGNLNNLLNLDFWGNALTGSIPWQLGNLSKLKWLNLSDNDFSGAVPWQLGKLSQLLYLWMHTNTSLEGSVPPSFAGLENLEQFYYDGTSLCDPSDTRYQTWLANVPSASGPPAVCVNLFKDSFELASLGSWDATQNFTVSAKCALDGKFGACAPFGKSAPRYLVKLLGTSETDLAVRFRLDVNSVPLPDGKTFKVLKVEDIGSGKLVYQLLLRRYSGKYQLKVIAKQDDGSTKKSGWIRIPDRPRIVEVEWEAASAPGANDGHLRLFVQGMRKAYLGGIDNDTFEAEQVTLGVMKTIKLSGKMKFDDIVIGTYGPIGMP
jgi:hypothetical protein